jgi:hypothetical protein
MKLPRKKLDVNELSKIGHIFFLQRLITGLPKKVRNCYRTTTDMYSVPIELI